MRKYLFFILSVLLTTSFCAFGKAPSNMVGYGDQIGKTYTFLLTGTRNGNIWGGKNNAYTLDSSLGTAAVHAGLLYVGETAEIQILIMKDRGSYPSIKRNGITSKSYGKYSGSYKITRKGYYTNNLGKIKDAPYSMQGYRGKIGETFTFMVRGLIGGSIWGGKNNIYTDDSSLGKAVVHAGLVKVGETEEIQVTVLKDQGSYPSMKRNGVTSKSYGAYSGAYQVKRKGYKLNYIRPDIPVEDEGNAPENMKFYRGNRGKRYVFRVKGSKSGSIWGGEDNVYTDDSSLGKAAVHAGLVSVGEVAEIEVVVINGKKNYPSLRRNGITSSSYGSYGGSYKIGLKGDVSIDDFDLYVDAPYNMSRYRNNVGRSYTLVVEGSDEGRIWGGEGNVYTDDSSLGKAAVHAGFVSKGHKALIKVTIMRGRSSYPMVTRNGITSRSYGSYDGSYKIQLVKRL